MNNFRNILDGLLAAGEITTKDIPWRDQVLHGSHVKIQGGHMIPVEQLPSRNTMSYGQLQSRIEAVVRAMQGTPGTRATRLRKAYEGLCWYDSRYAYYQALDPAPEPRQDACSCNNCRLSRDRLSLVIIEQDHRQTLLVQRVHELFNGPVSDTQPTPNQETE